VAWANVRLPRHAVAALLVLVAACGGGKGTGSSGGSSGGGAGGAGAEPSTGVAGSSGGTAAVAAGSGGTSSAVAGSSGSGGTGGAGGATAGAGGAAAGAGTGGSGGDSTDASASDATDASIGGNPLADQLARTWISAGRDVGDCLDVSSWYTFGADGSLTERDIDDNACYGLRLIAKLTGVYTLSDRVLEMTLNGMGTGTPYLGMSPPQTPVAVQVERFPILTAKIATPGTGAGYLAIDGSAYTSTDGAHFQSPRYVRQQSAAGARLSERQLTYAVTVDPPLPLAAGTPCRVQIDFSMVLFDAAALVTDESDTFRMTYDAIARATEDGWMRLMPRLLDGLSNADSYTVWHQMLDQAGLSTNHSARFASIFDSNFSYYLGYPTDDPRVLTQSLPQSGRWLEATKPLPIN